MAELNFNPTEINYILSGVNNEIARLCDEYIDKLISSDNSEKLWGDILERNELLQVIEDNQKNMDISIDMKYQKAINNLYSGFSLAPYQSHIKGGIK